MALSSRRLARRSIAAAAVGLLTAEFFGLPGAYRVAADPTAPPPGPSGEARLGCGTFCQTAGGYGGAGKPTQFAVTVDTSKTVVVDPDGYVPVTATCHLPVQCNGVLIVEVMSHGDNPLGGGRSDLVVNPGATRTIGVPSGSSVFGYLRSHGQSMANVTADARNSGVSETDATGALINLENNLDVTA